MCIGEDWDGEVVLRVQAWVIAIVREFRRCAPQVSVKATTQTKRKKLQQWVK